MVQTSKLWQNEEDDVIKQQVNVLPYDEICKLLPARTLDAIKHRVADLGLKKPQVFAMGLRRGGPWSNPYKKLTESQKGYLAGLIDGEGSLDVLYTRGYVSPRIVVVNTYLELMPWLTELLRGHWHLRQRPVARWKQGYSWYLTGSVQVVHLLEMLIPYMIIKKQEASDLVTEVKAVSTAWIAWEKLMAEKAKKLL